MGKSKKPKLGANVVYHPHVTDLEARENKASENAAIISQIFDEDDSKVSLRVFSHAIDGKVLLRTSVPHKDDAVGDQHYWE